MSSTSQRARPTPGTGKGADGRTDTRQRVTDAVGCPKSEASAWRRQRRIAMPIVPELSAASCRRREAVIGRRASSPTTAPSPPWRRPSSAGEKRLFVAGLHIDDAAWRQPHPGQRRCEEIGPRHAPEHLALRGAAIPAEKSAAAAPSIAPLPPPATSCNEPSASPSPGKRRSISATPNERTWRPRPLVPSRRWMRSRSSETTMLSTGRGILEGTTPQGYALALPVDMFCICSCCVSTTFGKRAC